MEHIKKRLFAWWRKSVENIRNGKWWLVALPIGTWLVLGSLEHWFFGWIIEHVSAYAGELLCRLIEFDGSFRLPLLVFVGVLLFFIIRAFFNSKPGIVGTADLMIQELNINDLKIGANWEGYTINLAAFARMEIASVDRPRTVTRFELEMIAPDKTEYKARSEYEVGNYAHKHDVVEPNDWGASTIQTVREPMEDLAAKVRVPIHPLTHVGRAWVRFEIADVKQDQEPHNCKIKIFAVDPSGRRHEIDTDDMQVKAIGDDSEYATLIKS